MAPPALPAVTLQLPSVCPGTDTEPSSPLVPANDVTILKLPSAFADTADLMRSFLPITIAPEEAHGSSSCPHVLQALGSNFRQLPTKDQEQNDKQIIYRQTGLLSRIACGKQLVGTTWRCMVLVN